MFLAFKNGVKSIQTAGYNATWCTTTSGHEIVEAKAGIMSYS